MTGAFKNLQNIFQRQEYYLHQGPAGFHGLIQNCSFALSASLWLSKFGINEVVLNAN